MRASEGSGMPHSDSEGYRQSRERRSRSRDRNFEREYDFRLDRGFERGYHHRRRKGLLLFIIKISNRLIITD